MKFRYIRNGIDGSTLGLKQPKKFVLWNYVRPNVLKYESGPTSPFREQYNHKDQSNFEVKVKLRKLCFIIWLDRPSQARYEILHRMVEVSLHD